MVLSRFRREANGNFRSIVKALMGSYPATSRLAAPCERGLLIMILLGGMSAFLSSLMSNRLAALVSRRLYTISSST